VGTRVIQQSSADTVADLELLQPILTQLAAAGPDLAGSLQLLISYPFPDSSLSALNYRKAQTGGYALFTNMTATLDFDLSRLLCRYVIDPTSGALEELNPKDLADGRCGVPGSPPANQKKGSSAGGTSSATRSTFTVPTLPSDVVPMPGADTVTGTPGLPLVPGGKAP
jgi:phospholipid/cholesterol/gamma-HCH transport system substrate-binding protein